MIDIKTGTLLEGKLPKKQLKYVQVWADIHKKELLNNFNDLSSEIQTYTKIEPLS